MLDIRHLSKNAQGFAEACYDQNTIEDLKAAHAAGDADESDMEAWDISPQGWRDAIEAALAAKLEDSNEEEE